MSAHTELSRIEVRPYLFDKPEFEFLKIMTSQHRLQVVNKILQKP